jgi:hypothetical protein
MEHFSRILGTSGVSLQYIVRLNGDPPDPAEEDYYEDDLDLIFSEMIARGATTWQQFEKTMSRCGTSFGMRPLARQLGVHKQAHRNMLEYGEPVSENAKVQKLLHGIQAPNIKTAKEVIFSSTALRLNFDELTAEHPEWNPYASQFLREEEVAVANLNAKEGKITRKHAYN